MAPITVTCKKNTNATTSCLLSFSVFGFRSASVPTPSPFSVYFPSANDGFGGWESFFLSSASGGGKTKGVSLLSWLRAASPDGGACGAACGVRLSRWRRRGWICRRHRREKADCSAPVGAAAAAATAGGRSWRRRRCDELCWRETVLLHGEAPSLLEKEETEGKGSAGLCFWRRRRVVCCRWEAVRRLRKDYCWPVAAAGRLFGG
jgi:hypothetical protein